MDVPLELARLGLTPTEARAVDVAVARCLRKLERHDPDLVSCQVSVERPQASPAGNPYKVRIRAALGGNVEVVVSKGAGDFESHLDVGAVVRGAFDALARQVRKERAKQRGAVKRRAEGEE